MVIKERRDASNQNKKALDLDNLQPNSKLKASISQSEYIELSRIYL